jgi:hypothetical protein
LSDAAVPECGRGFRVARHLRTIKITNHAGLRIWQTADSEVERDIVRENFYLKTMLIEKVMELLW